MAASERMCAGELPFIKPLDLMNLTTITRTAREKATLMIQLPPTGSCPRHMGIMEATIQDEIWVETQPNRIRRGWVKEVILSVKGCLKWN